MILNLGRQNFVLIFPSIPAAMSVVLTTLCVVVPSIPVSYVLLSLGFFAFIVSRFVFLKLSGERSLVRFPLRTVDLDARSCAFAIKRIMLPASNGDRFTVFVSDGSRRAELVGAFTLGGAKRQAERLHAMLLGDLPDAGRAPLRAHFAAELASLEHELSPPVQAAMADEYWRARGGRGKFVADMIVFALLFYWFVFVLHR